MAYQVETKRAKAVLDWIKDQAAVHGTVVEVYPDGVVMDGNWMHVPVYVNNGSDAYVRARLLQEIEDDWDAEVHDGVRLLLVPAKASESTKADFYSRISELKKRMDILLDQMAEEGSDGPNVERFRSIRQEWEETLSEMSRMYPSFTNQVG